MRRIALYILLTLLLATACNKSVMAPQQRGTISLELSSENEVVVNTKADAVDCSDFLVDIYGETFLGQPYRSEQYIYSSMPSEVQIPYGDYKVSAQNCLASEAEDGFGCVHYWGESAPVTVYSQTTEDVEVLCKMINGKVTMTFDDSFLEDFSNIVVELVSTRTETMTSEQANLPTDVYFNVPEEGAELVYSIYGTIAEGTESEKRLSYSNASSPIVLQRAKWAKITIKSNHNGLIGPDIGVENEMGSESYTEIINPEGDDTGVDSSIQLPSIIVDTQLDEAVVIDCVIDIF